MRALVAIKLRLTLFFNYVPKKVCNVDIKDQFITGLHCDNLIYKITS